MSSSRPPRGPFLQHLWEEGPCGGLLSELLSGPEGRDLERFRQRDKRLFSILNKKKGKKDKIC